MTVPLLCCLLSIPREPGRRKSIGGGASGPPVPPYRASSPAGGLRRSATAAERLVHRHSGRTTKACVRRGKTARQWQSCISSHLEYNHCIVAAHQRLYRGGRGPFDHLPTLDSSGKTVIGQTDDHMPRAEGQELNQH